MTLTPNCLNPWEQDPNAKIGPRGFPMLPGGFGRSTYYTGLPPHYAVKGEGAFVIDDKGRKLIDANNNFTVLVHGNAHPEITEVAVQAINEGTCWGIPNKYEWQHAEALLSRMPGMDMVRYSNSGTEAVMTAIRLSRAATGRDGVLMTRAGYHGSSDIAIATGTAKECVGVPKAVLQDATLIDLNDVAGLIEAVEAAPSRYAAIVIDLLPNRAGLIKVTEEYARKARELATKYGIVLIFDEVISLRLGFGGYCSTYGIQPDLLTCGKLIGGGFPIGAMVGIEPLMRLMNPTDPNYVPQAGTFSGNPVSMAAGAAALRLLTKDAIDQMARQGEAARAKISAKIAGTGWHVRGEGSLLRVFPDEGPYDVLTQRKIWWEMYNRGLLVSPANLVALTTVMTDAIVDELADITAESVLAVIGA